MAASDNNFNNDDDNNNNNFGNLLSLKVILGGVLSIGFLVVGILCIVYSCFVPAIDQSPRKDLDPPRGLVIRKHFFVSLGTACCAKAAFLLLDLLSPTAFPDLHIIASTFPEALFLTAYSILAVYVIQLYYTITSVPFEPLEAYLFVANCALYVILFALFLLAENGMQSFGSIFGLLGLGFLFTFAPMVYFSRGLLRLTGSISVQGKKVTARLTPLCIISSFAMFLFSAYFLILSIVLFSSGLDAYYEFDADVIGPFIVYLMTELCPCGAFLYIMSIATKSKRQNTETAIEFAGIVTYGSHGETTMRVSRNSSRENITQSQDQKSKNSSISSSRTNSKDSSRENILLAQEQPLLGTTFTGSNDHTIIGNKTGRSAFLELPGSILHKSTPNPKIEV